MAPPQPMSGRFVTMMVVLAAVVSLPLLPPQHLHRAGIEGRTEPLVHAHHTSPSDSMTESPATGAPSISHGDHRLAVFANGDYTTPGHAAGSAAPPAAGVSLLPVLDARSAVLRTGDHPIHGPPRLASAGRAPPTLS